MLYLALYFVALIFEFFVALGLMVYIGSLLYSSLFGAPYVPTKRKELITFLQEAGIKKGSLFLELGCGDGRVVSTAVDVYGAVGVGIDINPVLIYWARLLAKLHKIQGKLTYKTENITKTDVSQADIIYLFLLPKVIDQIKEKLVKKTKPTVLIISHGFRIDDWDTFLVKKLDRKPFPTYFYKIKR
ncbi:methyltransferase domain-containing protein [Candidatus Roizmanbacteria bacterium]|nr:methyltransferase domain-containing protein [Candidatus Roizmanbacteria bacterium]